MNARFSGPLWQAKSLSGRIFASVLAFVLAVLVAVTVVLTALFYLTYANDMEADLLDDTHELALALEAQPTPEDGIALLDDQVGGDFRCTLIDPQGEVLYDTDADEAAMENHADRPEVAEARADGEALSIRYSDTLRTDTVYAAVSLSDGAVVRLSESRSSLMAFLGNMIGPAAIIVLVAGVLVFALSRLLTRRIMKPIDALDFSRPLENEIYAEMDPLLFRIDEQQRLLKQQNVELAQAESMRRDFSSNVSHEMKTPLQVISGYAELMKNDMVDPADRRKFAGLIYEEAQAMRSLINDVLALSRLDETSLTEADSKPVDVGAQARRVLTRLESFAADQGVKMRVSGGPAFVMGNETMVEEMLYNLMENGIRYNHPGGEVSMAISVEAAGAGSAAGESVVVRVSDTGPGIPEEYRDKIFERFFRVDKSRSKETGGTGLGLAIVKHTVLYHHGTIEVESEVGKGTTFIVRLAAVKPE